MKKFLISAAAVAALTTSALAYETSDLQYLDWNTSINVKDDSNISFCSKHLGEGLLFPVVFADNSWSTTIKVSNPTDKAVVAKVVIYDKNDSKELKDFNIYLSPNDTFDAKIVKDGDVYKVISTDDSMPNPADDELFATEDSPVVTTFTGTPGYAMVIGMVALDENILDKTFDHDHPFIRKVYKEIVANYRNGGKPVSGTMIDVNGVYTGTLAPIVDLNASKKSEIPNNKGAIVVDNVKYGVQVGVKPGDGNISVYSLAGNSSLMGEESIVDGNINAQATIPAIPYIGLTAGGDTLLYFEGEKAHIADADLDYNNSAIYYNVDKLISDVQNMTDTNTTLYMSYEGDADSFVNNRMIFTAPYKRVAVQAVAAEAQNDYNNNYTIATELNKTDETATDVATVLKNYFSINGVEVDSNDLSKVLNYGYYDLTAMVYDMNENVYTAPVGFSPAVGGKLELKLPYEVSSTETTLDKKLSEMMVTVQADGKFKKGYIYINPKDTAFGLIPTFMRGVEVNGQPTISWFRPIGK